MYFQIKLKSSISNTWLDIKVFELILLKNPPQRISPHLVLECPYHLHVLGRFWIPHDRLFGGYLERGAQWSEKAKM